MSENTLIHPGQQQLDDYETVGQDVSGEGWTTLKNAHDEDQAEDVWGDDPMFEVGPGIMGWKRREELDAGGREAWQRPSGKLSLFPAGMAPQFFASPAAEGALRNAA